jgi:predicted transcriptional regulator of viral defense system
MPAKRLIPSDLTTFVNQRQSQGLYYFIRDDASKALKISDAALKQAAARLIKKKRIVRVFSGFYIIIPLEYAATGMLPAEWFIADLMAYIGQPYYAGLLSAAVFHGAAHQQPQEFQIVTDKPLRKILLKTLSIRFLTKSNFSATPTVQKKVQTGFINVSTPEATAFDLVRYARAIGGLDSVLTVLKELGELLNADALVKSAMADGNLAYAQRLGWLFEQAGFGEAVSKLASWVSKNNPCMARLEPSLPVRGAETNDDWKLLINTTVETDL